MAELVYAAAPLAAELSTVAAGGKLVEVRFLLPLFSLYKVAGEVDRSFVLIHRQESKRCTKERQGDYMS